MDRSRLGRRTGPLPGTRRLRGRSAGRPAVLGASFSVEPREAADYVE